MIDSHKREYVSRGNVLFPMQYYTCDTTEVLYDLPLHWHTDFEILRVKEGEYNMFIACNEVALQAGDIAFITSGVLHGDGSTIGAAKFESVVFDPEMLRHRLYAVDTFLSRLIDVDTNGLVSASISLVVKASSKDNEEILSAADRLFTTMEKKPNGYALLATGLVMEMLGIIEGKHLYSETVTVKNSAEQMKRLKGVLDYVKENYAVPLTLETLSSSACLSPHYFCRVFRNVMKCSPIDYLNKYRISRACEILCRDTSSVKDAAQGTGFTDISYFIRLFRRYKGITPLKYKKAVSSLNKNKRGASAP